MTFRAERDAIGSDDTSAQGARAKAQALPGRKGSPATPDLCVIGAGAGGLTVAAAAASLGVSVVLVEKHRMGGDCLNSGCVPSKALIAAARRADAIRRAGTFGIEASEPVVDFARLGAHVRGVIDDLAPNDAAERFEALGVTVVRAAGRFLDGRTLEAGDTLVKARRFIVATGSSPLVPAIPGLEQVPYLTNETIFSPVRRIDRLAVVGAGAVGLELAQAYRRLGAEVTVLEQNDPLGREDPELKAVLLRQLCREGVVIEGGVSIDRIGGRSGSIKVEFRRGAAQQVVDATHLLIAAGRKPNIDRLGLEVAGVQITGGRIAVDAGMRTTNKRIFAIGAVAGGGHTHEASAHAEIVVRRALFRQPARIRVGRVPRVTFTDPELAQVGSTEAEARAARGAVAVYRWPFADNDRAVIDRTSSGLVKVVCCRNGTILGAGIVGPAAGELIGVWSLAIAQGLTIDAMTRWIAPYPTLGEISKRVAVAARAENARRPLVRKLLTLLRKMG